MYLYVVIFIRLDALSLKKIYNLPFDIKHAYCMGKLHLKFKKLQPKEFYKILT